MSVRDHATDIAARFVAGSTLQEIGDYYGVTREYVRQIISEETDLTSRDGGRAVRTKAKQSAAAARRDQKYLARYGMTRDEYKHVNSTYSPRPICAFWRQKANAARRNIEWDLSFAEWWCIWSESGKWEQRGRSGYVMARHSDSGPYAVGNVKIIRSRDNNSEYIRRYWKEVHAGERPQPRRPRGMYSDMSVGESRTRALSDVARLRNARNAATNYASSRGWKFKTRIADGVLTVTRTS